MAVAFLLGALSTIPLLGSGNVWAYAVIVAAGVAAAFLVTAVRPGLSGVLLGVGGAFAVWGGYEVVQKLLSCPDNCSGLSSPTITIVIVVGFGLTAIVAAGAGYAIGRIVRTIGRRLTAARA